jgi:hypothetical protein
MLGVAKVMQGGNENFPAQLYTIGGDMSILAEIIQ